MTRQFMIDDPLERRRGILQTERHTLPVVQLIAPVERRFDLVTLFDWQVVKAGAAVDFGEDFAVADGLEQIISTVEAVQVNQGVLVQIAVIEAESAVGPVPFCVLLAWHCWARCVVAGPHHRCNQACVKQLLALLVTDFAFQLRVSARRADDGLVGVEFDFEWRV